MEIREPGMGLAAHRAMRAEMRVEIRRLVLVEGWKIETVARRFGVPPRHGAPGAV